MKYIAFTILLLIATSACTRQQHPLGQNEYSFERQRRQAEYDKWNLPQGGEILKLEPTVVSNSTGQYVNVTYMLPDGTVTSVVRRNPGAILCVTCN